MKKKKDSGKSIKPKVDRIQAKSKKPWSRMAAVREKVYV
jgi:hypothetical protein